MDTHLQQNRMLDYLPAIYYENDFIKNFLKAFEKVLLSREPEPGIDFPYAGLEETITNMSAIFDPQETPEKFLAWLSDWTAFALRADLDILKQRDFISNIIQLYKRRGTKVNLQNLLKIFTIGTPTISEEGEVSGLQIGVTSTINVDTKLGGSIPHFFKVSISLPRSSEDVLNRQMDIARSLIELQKPAHTYYKLEPQHPTIIIAQHSTIGVDTILGIQIHD